MGQNSVANLVLSICSEFQQLANAGCTFDIGIVFYARSSGMGKAFISECTYQVFRHLDYIGLAYLRRASYTEISDFRHCMPYGIYVLYYF